MISKKLIKSSFIYTVIGALPMISGFILLLFYTNYISKHDYGAFVLYIAFTLFVQVLINFGLDTYIAISYFYVKDDAVLLQKKTGYIIGYLLAFGIISIIVLSAIGKPLFWLIFNDKDLMFFPYGFMCVITAFCNSFFKTYTNLLINKEQPNQFALANMANFIMTISFSLIGLFLYPNTLIGPMWGRLLSGIGIFIIAFIYFIKNSHIKLVLGDELKEAFRFSYPVVIFFLFSWSFSNLNSFLMKSFISLDGIAIFGLAMQFTLLVEFVLNGMSSALSPKIYSLIKNNNLTASTPELNKYFSGLNAFSLLLIPTSSFIIPLVLPILIGKDYHASFVFLAILNIGFATRGLYNYLLTPIYIFKKTNILPKMHLITFIFQIIISIFLIKYWGIWGAVFSSLLLKVIQNIVLYFGVRKIFTFSFNTFKFIWLPIIITILIICSEYFINTYNLHYIRFAQAVVSYILIYICYKNEVKELYKELNIIFRKVLHL